MKRVRCLLVAAAALALLSGCAVQTVWETVDDVLSDTVSVWTEDAYRISFDVPEDAVVSAFSENGAAITGKRFLIGQTAARPAQLGHPLSQKALRVLPQIMQRLPGFRFLQQPARDEVVISLKQEGIRPCGQRSYATEDTAVLRPPLHIIPQEDQLIVLPKLKTP